MTRTAAPNRHRLYNFAWALFLLSLPLYGAHLIGDCAAFSRELAQGGVSLFRFAGMLLFVLAVFSNLIFVSTLLIRDAPQIFRGWRILLIASLIVNATIVLFFPFYLRWPGYYLWFSSFAVVTWALLLLPADPARVAKRAKESQRRPLTDRVPILLWAWLFCTFFWLGVTLLEHRHPVAERAAASTTPVPKLDQYVIDRSHLLDPGQVRRLNDSLAAFEKETSNQLVLDVDAAEPDGALEDFTLRAAEGSHAGVRGRDNGAILFLMLKRKMARLEVGYGLEGALPDSAVYRILDEQLATRARRGELADGIDQALDAIMTRARAEYQRGKRPGRLTVGLARLQSLLTNPSTWTFLRDTTVDQRIGLSFFAGLISFVIGGGFLNAGRLLTNAGRVGVNLLRRRPLLDGTREVELASIWNIAQLIILVSIPIAGIVVLIAGGGSFGGAGASVHW